MTLIPWRNKRDERASGGLAPLAELRREMDRVFEGFFGSWDDDEAALAAWNPAVDVEETDREVTVRAELPGIDPKDLDIRVQGDQLLLAGEKKECSEKRSGNVYHRESRYGSFRRSVRLPAEVDPAQVTADYAQGVLTVKLHKSPTAVARRIPVKTG
jgi:HSP20 family protein